MNQNWGLIGAIGAGVLAFVGGFAFVLNQRSNAPAANVAQPAPPANPQPEPSRKDAPPDKEKNKDKSSKDDGTIGKIATPTRPALLKRWQMDQPPKPKGEEAPNYERYFCREIGVDQTGFRIVTQTQLEAVCWETASGTRVQTFKAASEIVPRKPPDKPELRVDEEIFITRDARIVARVRRDGTRITFHEAATGRQIGVYNTPKGKSRYLDYQPPAFTPRGDYLLFMQERDALVAVNTETATGAEVRMPANWTKAHTNMWRVLIPAPQESVLIRHAIGDQGIFALDLKTGQERQIKSVNFEPFSLFENRGIKLSPNGRYLSARRGEFVVVDWKEDRKLTYQTGGHFQEWFTPDGKRLVVATDTNIIQYQTYPYKRLTPIGGWLELYDVEKGVMIGKCVLEDHGIKEGTAALAFSGDGKKFALGDRHASVALFDFELAFGVPSLPPLPRPPAESLPLR
jgi:hypothetical protein